MKRRNKKQSYLKKLLSVTLVCGLLLTFFVPGMTVSAAGVTLVTRTIASGGEYTVPRGWDDPITITTTDPVTLIAETRDPLDFRIQCSVAGVNLSLKSLNICMPDDIPFLLFTGKGNKLTAYNNFFSNNHRELIDAISAPVDVFRSVIHVPEGVELTLSGSEAPNYFSAELSKPFDMEGISRTTTRRASIIGGDRGEKGGTVNVESGTWIIETKEDHNGEEQPVGLIGGGEGAGMEKINIRNGTVIGKLGSGIHESTLPESERGYVTINGNCLVQGSIMAPYTFTNGIWADPGKWWTDEPDSKKIVRGDVTCFPSSLTHFSVGHKMIIEEGAQLTYLASGSQYSTINNYGTLVIDGQHFQLIDNSSRCSQLKNYGKVIVNSGRTIDVGDNSATSSATRPLDRKAQLINYPSGVIENNGHINCVASKNLVANMGEIKGNELEGTPEYETLNGFHSNYYFTISTDKYTQYKETNYDLIVNPSIISDEGYDNVGIKVTSITQPQGVTNGLSLKEVADDGTVSAVEIGKLWYNGKGFTLPYNQRVKRPMKLTGSAPGDYEVTYALVNLDDDSEITTRTLKYTVKPSPIEALSTLDGITINGKAIEPFDKDTLTYETEIRADAEDLTVTAAMTNPDASYTVDKPDVPVEGKNVVTITCTSQDKSSTTVYTVNVNKPKLIEGIKALYLDGKPCEDFDSQNTNSIITISDTQISSRFTYTLSNPADRVLADTLTGKKLRVGNNICIVKIGDSRGTLKVQYAITVKVVKGAAVPDAQLSDNTNLKSLTVNGVSAVMTNNPAQCINVILVDNRTTAAITAVAEDSHATVTYTASLSLRPGNNLTFITVLSSDKSKQVRYNLCVRYQTLDNAPIPSTGAGDSTALQAITVGDVQAVIPESGSIIVEVGRITDLPAIVVTTQDPNAAVQIKYLAAKVRTGNNIAQIIVQSSDKSKKTTYTLVYRVS